MAPDKHQGAEPLISNLRLASSETTVHRWKRDTDKLRKEPPVSTPEALGRPYRGQGRCTSAMRPCRT